MTIQIDGSSPDFETLHRFLGDRPPRVALAPAARERVIVARKLIENILAEGRVVYGINTGFGKLSNTRIPPEDLGVLQRNLLLSHASGVGAPLPRGVVRLAILLRANALARGHSGVRPRVIEALLDLLNADCLPVIPCQGSVGASGDLAPLSHLALMLIGEGEAEFEGEVLSSKEALRRANLEPVTLQAKEGLALINGTQISCALGLTAYLEARSLVAHADLAAALTLEALRGSVKPFDGQVAAVRPHPGHVETAANMRALLAGSEIVASHVDCGRVQDQYSLRCVPQVHGAARDALRHLGEVLEREMGSVTDNPLIFPETGEVISAGNFHAEPLALPFDYGAIAVSELANISERRIEFMVNPDLSGLPPFLTEHSGLNSGFMIAQVTAAALVSENKSLCHPASVDSIPTSANKEDHVSMAPIAARQLAQVTENTAHVLAIEFLSARQALHLGGDDLRPGRGAAAAYDLLKEEIPPWEQDRIMKNDIDRVRALMRSGALTQAARAAAHPGGESA